MAGPNPLQVFLGGVMLYVTIAGMVAVSNGVTQAVSGQTLTGYMTQVWGRVWPMGE